MCRLAGQMRTREISKKNERPLGESVRLRAIDEGTEFPDFNHYLTMQIRKTALIFTLSFCIAFITSCAPTAVVIAPKPAPTKQAPPGQAKKATGSKSAKAYAPGQQKKKQR